MNKNEILIIEGKNYKEMTKELLIQSRLSTLIGDRNARIALKPNLVSPSPPSYGATTHTEVLAGIIEYLQDEGFFHITIMEGSWVGSLTKDAFDVAGYDQLCRDYQVPFIDMQKEKGVKVDCSGMPIQICKSALDVDYLINVPVVKGHCQTRITCALKNLKGLIPNAEKRRFHSLGLHQPIAHLNTGIRQDFIVADNICGDLDFEDGGHPVEMNRIITARDPVLLDAYICDLLHLSPCDVPYLQIAEKLGVGSADLTKAVIRQLGECSDTFALKASQRVLALADAVNEVESCSACYGSLLPAMERLDEELKAEGWQTADLKTLLGSKICIGQGWRGKTGATGIGNCTRLFTHHVEGCPPSEDQVYQFLKSLVFKNE